MSDPASPFPVKWGLTVPMTKQYHVDLTATHALLEENFWAPLRRAVVQRQEELAMAALADTLAFLTGHYGPRGAERRAWEDEDQCAYDRITLAGMRRSLPT